MAEVQGTCEARFEGVRRTLSSNLDSGADVGASVAVYLHGEPVVDIWGGYIDAAKSAPWERDTLTNVWSTTKTMTFLCALMLADCELCTSLLAAQKPWWEPGTASGYHALTQGYLIGEVVRRITGESIGAWFAREVAKPLDAAFF